MNNLTTAEITPAIMEWRKMLAGLGVYYHSKYHIWAQVQINDGIQYLSEEQQNQAELCKNRFNIDFNQLLRVTNNELGYILFKMVYPEASYSSYRTDDRDWWGWPLHVSYVDYDVNINDFEMVVTRGNQQWFKITISHLETNPNNPKHEKYSFTLKKSQIGMKDDSWTFDKWVLTTQRTQ